VALLPLLTVAVLLLLLKYEIYSTLILDIQ
jgi:hypothetical protein